MRKNTFIKIVYINTIKSPGIHKIVFIVNLTEYKAITSKEFWLFLNKTKYNGVIQTLSVHNNIK